MQSPRLYVLIATMLALALSAPVVVPTTASAAPAKISLSVGAGTVAAGTTYVVKGRVSPASGRAVKVQSQRGRRWVTVAKGRSTKRGAYSLKLTAPATPTTLKVRAIAPKALVGGRRVPAVVSATRTVNVYARSDPVTTPSVPVAEEPLAVSVTASAPSLLLVGESLAVTVAVSPPTTREVQLQELVDGSWRTVVDGWTRPEGAASLVITPTTGQHTYRANVPAAGTWASATSTPLVVDVRPAPAPTSRLQVLMTGLPAGVAGDVSLTAPDGQVLRLTAGQTLEQASLGAWSVSAAPVKVGTDTFHAVEDSLTTTVTRGQAATLVIDYGVVVPETTSVVPTPAIQSVTDLGDGIYEVVLTAALLRTTSSHALDRREKRQQSFVAASAVGAAPASAQCAQWSWGILCEGNMFVSDVSANARHGAFGRVRSLTDPLTFQIDSNGVTLADAIPFGATQTGVIKGVATSSGSLETKWLTCEGSTTASLDAEVSLTPSLEFDARFAGGELKEAKVVSRLDQRASASVTLNGKGKCEIPEFHVVPARTLPPVTVTVGPVPVVFVPKVELRARAEASINGTATVALTQTASSRSGIEYTTDQGFRPVLATDRPAVTRQGPSFDGSASASATLTASIDFLLYGAGGPRLVAEASLSGKANAKASPAGATLDWSVNAALRGYGQFRVDVLGVKVQSPEITFWEPAPLTLAQGSWSWNPPPGYLPEITTAALPRAQAATPYDVRLTTNDNRPGRWGVESGTLPPGLQLDPDNGRISGATTSAGSSTFTVSFTDGYGSSTSRSLTLESDPMPDDLLPDAYTGLPTVPAYDVLLPVAAEHGGTWEVVDPSQLPANLTFDPSGRLHGRYPSSGQYQFTVRNIGIGLSKTYRLSAVRLELSQNCAYRPGYTSIFVNMGWPDSAGNQPHHVVLKLNGEVVADTTTQPGGGFVKLWDALDVSRPYDVLLTVDGVAHTFRALCP